MKTLAVIATIAVLCGLVFLFMRGSSEQQVRVSSEDIRVALAEALVEDPHVGRLPRVRFSRLTLDDEDGLFLLGKRRWFNIGAGGFPFPDINLRVEIPAEPDAWVVRNGGLTVTRVVVVAADRLAYDGGAETPESEANRAGWERLIVQLFDRMDSFGEPRVRFANWQVEAVEIDTDGLVFTLRR
ncbi:hypothetical protein [Gymnodinialimonas hymeniacidonis]|uniref:hypothetical protein n=1 Tax=Gymnodinialimonas hymeniacidonis TaxID=3126508 RepID=UPI0034C5CD53